MGWFERLSGSDEIEGTRNASVAENVEIGRYRDHHPPLKSDESIGWEGHLLTGYHLHKIKKDASTEYVTLDLPGRTGKINP
jgi:hypothetical protein